MEGGTNQTSFVCLFDLILYVPSTIFQLNRDRSSWVEPVLSWDKCVLLKDHNAVTPVRLEPAAPLSRVKGSTTEPLCSLNQTSCVNNSLSIYSINLFIALCIVFFLRVGGGGLLLFLVL